ncbi:MAG TPA: hypothetical protein VF719_02495, partial [Abditibacteriaceae bacterium]
MKKNLSLLSLVLCLMAFVYSAISPAHAQTGKIAFTSYRDGQEEIYTMNMDGTEQTRLTFLNGQRNQAPHWSPDGT